jgi:four helix bundle protein
MLSLILRPNYFFMAYQDLKRRTFIYSSSVWKFCDLLPERFTYACYGKQLVRCSSSVAANYRASQRAKSKADFINKLKIVEEELDESMYFLELFSEIDPKLGVTAKPLLIEANELLSIIVASLNRARSTLK